MYIMLVYLSLYLSLSLSLAAAAAAAAAEVLEHACLHHLAPLLQMDA